MRNRNWSQDKPYVLITGGVHGYETSGVQGTLLWLQTKAEEYSDHFNILVAPCISPWAYETIQRWTAKVIDPNKTFNPDKNSKATTDEALAFVAHLKSFGVEQWTCHIDCHETTDSDKYEFKPTR